jgi:hypothetical protein
MLLVFRDLWNDETSVSIYREIMLRNKSIFSNQYSYMFKFYIHL